MNIFRKDNQDKQDSQDNLQLNLGGGRRRYPNFINVDKAALPETDLQWNLEKVPLPFAENSVSKIISEHTLEHVFNFVELLEEMYRITKPGGVWEIVVPYYKYEGTFRDPTHRCFFSENTFDYFKEGNTFDYYSPVRVKILKKELLIYLSLWAKMWLARRNWLIWKKCRTCLWLAPLILAKQFV